MSLIGCQRSIKMLSDGRWNFKGLPTKIYPATMFDKAHEELETKYGKYMKALIDFENLDFEPYIING
jgi:threonine dehydrogenase-like Zn-dependent dehydrogenase